MQEGLAGGKEALYMKDIYVCFEVQNKIGSRLVEKSLKANRNSDVRMGIYYTPSNQGQWW